jgi:hypothetical protein
MITGPQLRKLHCGDIDIRVRSANPGSLERIVASRSWSPRLSPKVPISFSREQEKVKKLTPRHLQVYWTLSAFSGEVCRSICPRPAQSPKDVSCRGVRGCRDAGCPRPVRKCRV